jgi:hypothetical protein
MSMMLYPPDPFLVLGKLLSGMLGTVMVTFGPQTYTGIEAERPTIGMVGVFGG